MIFSCASQLPPGGGEEDKIPPEIISYYPPQAATNFSDDKVVFEFNEYIDKRTFQESIFISPYFEESPEISWSGREVEIIFPERLKENQTYVITLGTDISDLRRNKLSETFTLKFSTGDKIDEGSISGQIYDDNPFNIMVYLFKIDSANSIVKYSDKKPDYVSQTSREGKFNLLGLNNGWYRLLAVRDQFKDLLYQIEQDQVGFALADIFLSDSLNKKENIYIEMTREDTAKPVVLSVKSIDNNHLLAVFNEPIDSTSLIAEKIILRDKKDYIAVEPLGHFRARLPGTSIFLLFDELKDDYEYELKTFGINDYFGNESDTSIISFLSNAGKDTTAPKLLDSRPFEKSATTDYLNPIIYFLFDDFIANENLKSGIVFKDSSNKDVEFEIKYIDQSSFHIIPKLSLIPKMDYRLSLDLKYFKDLAGNKVDSVFTISFRTNDESYFSEIIGTVKNLDKDKSDKVFISARGIDGPRQKYSAKVDTSGKYELKRILQGSYLLKMFQDESGQGKQFLGSSVRNEFSNKFVYYPDTIKIKPRWPVTDVDFDYEKLSR
ncbi:MAG: Ig-like domain-containing protein [Bacteroidetes bacterium]|nr:Ig-like domain-containing protein [Bacteroidota bacterium]MBU2584722.1 Ig-like domain-containing protein [Bacteroidota bacterium]